jgi:3-oxoacyl-ACP reductase-like protein
MAQLINEAKRMQFLAGLINESQLNEEDNAATEEKVQDTVEKAIDSPQAQATLQKMASQLSDEDKQRIMKFMSSVNESAAGGGEPDLEDVTKKLMSLAEISGPQDPQNRSTAKNLLGQVVYGAPVAAMGAGLIKGILAGGAAVGLAAATPLFAAAAAGAVLIGLYKIIKSASSNKPKPTSGGVSGVNRISNPIVKK